MNTTTNTTTETTEQHKASLIARLHNQPGAKEIVSAINAGIEAARSGENACMKLTHAFYNAMVTKVDESGATIVSYADALKYCRPWADDVTVTEGMRTTAADYDKSFITDLCVEWSSKYNAADKVKEELKGKRSSEAAKITYDQADKVTRAVNAMIKRAIFCATYMVTLLPEKVNLDDKKWLLNIVIPNDRLTVTIALLETMAKDFFPSKTKEKGADKSAEETAEERVQTTESILSSVAYLRKFIDPRTFAAFDKTTKDELKELYAVLTAVFAEKDSAPILIKKKA